MSDERTITVSRYIDAPCAAVWHELTDAQAITESWGAPYMTCELIAHDFREGGRWHYIMHAPEGMAFNDEGVFREVVPESRLVRAVEFNEGHPAAAMQGVVTTYSLAPENKGTHLTIDMMHRTAADKQSSLVSQVSGCIEASIDYMCKRIARSSRRMMVELPAENAVRFSRFYAAPPTLVYECFMKAEHLRQWWGCPDLAMPVCEVDLRVGGAYHIVQEAPDGSRHPFRGEYREIEPGAKIVHTFVYDVEGIRDHPALESLAFEAFDGGTLLINSIEHDSRESRDAYLQSGAEGGARTSLDRLEALVASLRQSATP